MTERSFIGYDSDRPIRLGVSACLLGEQVRFDSGHKRNAFITDQLTQFFEMVPVCPEVAIGLGVPREPIRLEGPAETPRAVGVKHPALDVTDRLAAHGRQMAERLGGISGYLFKSKSPSCGMERVKLYGTGGAPSKQGRGIYAAEIMRARPLMPVEEEGRLNDPVLRENFISRVYAWHRWQCLLEEGLTPAALVDFHAAHKLILMSHDKQALGELGRLVADAGRRPLEVLADDYIAGFMRAMARPPTRKRHTDTLQHAMGYLKKALDGGDKAEILDVIDHYRRGLVPLIVPVTLLRHHFRRHPEPYIDRQLYLRWPPAQLGLWNSI
ncbi:MAG: DUF523 and DUF1722 domain-containing protein [Gammaproteobacteria bacterium]|jgi:uncharacterized protein YbgA (DUF1722 family)/uncharacterized protein YbbK (DUF523 family)